MSSLNHNDGVNSKTSFAIQHIFGLFSLFKLIIRGLISSTLISIPFYLMGFGFAPVIFVEKLPIINTLPFFFVMLIVLVLSTRNRFSLFLLLEQIYSCLFASVLITLSPIALVVIMPLMFLCLGFTAIFYEGRSIKDLFTTNDCTQHNPINAISLHTEHDHRIDLLQPTDPRTDYRFFSQSPRSLKDASPSSDVNEADELPNSDSEVSTIIVPSLYHPC